MLAVKKEHRHKSIGGSLLESRVTSGVTLVRKAIERMVAQSADEVPWHVLCSLEGCLGG
jgi:hypothetical protein